MGDLLDWSEKTAKQDAKSNLPELSVSDISRAIKTTLESAFGRVRVRGEISGFKRAASGHLYMSLKDDDAVINAVCWRGSAARLGLKPEDGMEVIAVGRISSFPGRSSYQLVIERLELAGEGALLKLLEDRRRKLAAEGLFDSERKKPLPYLPEVIGVVTSPTGAVIRDILHRLADRFPRRVLLAPVLVQGDGAAGQVAAAIKAFNAMPEDGEVPRPDLLIVARGGGSLEDLWAFNEEEVVRATAASDIPLISAVGHETDTTLIDHASDHRAPTPTAAAEMAVPVRAELLSLLKEGDRRLLSGINRLLSERRNEVAGLARGLPDPRRLLEEKTQQLDDRSERLRYAMNQGVERRHAVLREYYGRLPHPRQLLALAGQAVEGLGQRLRLAKQRDGDRLQLSDETLQRLGRDLQQGLNRRLERTGDRLREAGALLESYSYQKTLERGFVVVRGAEGVVPRADAVMPGMKVELEFHDGRVAAQTLEETPGSSSESEASPKPARKKKAAPRKKAKPVEPGEFSGRIEHPDQYDMF